MAGQAQVISGINKGLWKRENASSIEIGWDIPTHLGNIDSYEIRYRDITNKQIFDPDNHGTSTKNSITLFNLKSDIEYEIKGFILQDGEQTKIFQETFKTKPSRIEHLIPISKRVPSETQKLEIYKLPFYTHIDDADLREYHMISRYEQPSFREGPVNEKTILVVGATGTGKSTLIEAMINHIVGVSFSDSWRFKTIDVTDISITEEGNQSFSQTRTTTCYRIPHLNGFSIDFSLNIIDTPGFNDTHGRCYDKIIPQQIRKLFESVIHSLHAVCIVVPLSTNRLTDAEMWTFTNILNLFGANIKNIIYPCITYAEGSKDKIESTLNMAGFEFEKSFIFSNADLFEDKPDFTSWKNRQNSFKEFFEAISNVEPHCIKNSEKVLRMRENKTIQLGHIQDKIRIQVELINTIKHEQSILKTFEGDVKANANFSYEVAVCIKTRNISKKESVNCTICEESCHAKCNVPFDILLYFCEIFHKGKCTICTKRCSKDSHVREKYKYENVFVKEKRTKEDLETKYQYAINSRENQRRMVETEKTKLRESLEELNNIIQRVNELIASLNEIALKREQFKIEKYFEDLIDLEEDRQEHNFLERIDCIRQIKDSLQNKTKFRDLLRDFERLLQ